MTSENPENPVSQRLDAILLIALFLICFRLFFILWITGDGLSYFSYLRSIVVDGDLNFRNEFSYVETWGTGSINCGGELTATGYVGNCFSIGPAILWSTFYVPSYLTRESLFSGSAYAGYGRNEIFAVCFATMFYSFIGVFLLYELLQKLTTRFNAFIAVVVSWFATPLVYYMYHEPSMAHGLSFFAVTLFLYFWFTRKEKTWFNYVLLGACGGLMMLVRWQNALFLVIPLLENTTAYRIERNKSLVKKTLALLLTAFLVFSPQIIAWKIIYGSYLTIPQGEGFIDLFHPHILEFLFSGKHGLFTWTPAYLIASAGLYLLYKKEKETAVYLTTALLLQTYLNSSVSSWHGDWAFGARRMVESMPIFAIGLAYALNSMRGFFKIFIVLLLLAAITWNILLLTQVSFNHTLIDPNVPYGTLTRNQFTIAPELFKKLVESRF